MEQRKTFNAACKQTLRRKPAETKGKEMSLMKTSQIQEKNSTAVAGIRK